MLNLIKIFKKTLSFVKIFENLDFGKKKIRKISILVNINENLEFGKNLWKYRLWWKLSK